MTDTSIAYDLRAAALEAALCAEFPFAPVRRDPQRVDAWARALSHLAEGEEDGVRLPLDVRGSRFERRVWDAIRAIPRGTTRSYGELARAIGAPRAARAVACACARNPVPLAVPCHRVVPARAAPGGYSGGAARKRALLAREAGARRASRVRGSGCGAGGPAGPGCGAAQPSSSEIAPVGQ